MESPEDNLISMSEEDFNLYVDNINMEGIVEAISVLQKAMGTEQEKFNQLSTNLGSATNPNSPEYQRMTQDLKEVQEKLTMLMGRNMKCFSKQVTDENQDPEVRKMNDYQFDEDELREGEPVTPTLVRRQQNGKRGDHRVKKVTFSPAPVSFHSPPPSPSPSPGEERSEPALPVNPPAKLETDYAQSPGYFLPESSESDSDSMAYSTKQKNSHASLLLHHPTDEEHVAIKPEQLVGGQTGISIKNNSGYTNGFQNHNNNAKYEQTKSMYNTNNGHAANTQTKTTWSERRNIQNSIEHNDSGSSNKLNTANNGLRSNSNSTERKTFESSAIQEIDNILTSLNVEDELNSKKMSARNTTDGDDVFIKHNDNDQFRKNNINHQSISLSANNNVNKVLYENAQPNIRPNEQTNGTHEGADHEDAESDKRIAQIFGIQLKSRAQNYIPSKEEQKDYIQLKNTVAESNTDPVRRSSVTLVLNSSAGGKSSSSTAKPTLHNIKKSDSVSSTSSSLSGDNQENLATTSKTNQPKLTNYYPNSRNPSYSSLSSQKNSTTAEEHDYEYPPMHRDLYNKDNSQAMGPSVKKSVSAIDISNGKSPANDQQTRHFGIKSASSSNVNSPLKKETSSRSEVTMNGVNKDKEISKESNKHLAGIRLDTTVSESDDFSELDTSDVQSAFDKPVQELERTALDIYLAQRGYRQVGDGDVFLAPEEEDADETDIEDDEYQGIHSNEGGDKVKVNGQGPLAGPPPRKFDSHGFTDESKVEERVHLKNWDPTKLLQELYEIQLAPDDGRCIYYSGKYKKAPPDGEYINMEGYMEKLPINKKKATLLKTWKRRYFKSRDGYLYYYEANMNDSRPNGYFGLMGGSVEDLGNRMIGLDDGRGHYMVIRCPTDSEFLDWLKSLESQTFDNSRHNYVKPVLYSQPSLEKKVVIIDIGSCSARAGLLGEEASLPQVFFPTIMASDKRTGAEVYGFDTLKPEVRENSVLSYPIRPSVKIDKFALDMEAMSPLFSKIFKELKINPEQYWVMFSTPGNFSDKLKEQFMNMLIDEFNIQGANMVNQTLLSLYSYNATSGIVVDIGERLEIVPVTDGYIVEGGVTRQPYGGHRVTEALNKTFTESRYHFFTDVEFQIVRLAKEKTCYVAYDYKDEFKKCKADPEPYRTTLELKNYDLPKGSYTDIVHDLGRFKSTEGLFNTEMWGIDNPPLQKLIFKAIQACPMDTRREMWRSIYLSGGVTLLPGFPERLQNELAKLAPSSINVQIHASPQRYHSAFIGASTLANLKVFEKASISAHEWRSRGALSLSKWRMY